MKEEFHEVVTRWLFLALATFSTVLLLSRRSVDSDSTMVGAQQGLNEMALEIGACDRSIHREKIGFRF